MGDFLCFSFSFCLSKDITLCVMLKFDFIKGYFSFSLVLEICVTVQMFSIPNPPFVIIICVGGQLHVFVVTDCQVVAPVCLMGNGFFRITFFIMITVFKVFTIDHTLAEIKFSIEVGFEIRGYAVGCRRDERRRRRWTWHLRRRNKRKCHNYHQCDVYQKILLEFIIPGFCLGIICIPPGMWKLNFCDTKWMSDNERFGEFWLDIHAPKDGLAVWNICWQKCWGKHECYRKAGTPGDPGGGIPKDSAIPPLCYDHVTGSYAGSHARNRYGIPCIHQWLCYQNGLYGAWGDVCKPLPWCQRTYQLWNSPTCAKQREEAEKEECARSWNCRSEVKARRETYTQPYLPWNLYRYNEFIEECGEHYWRNVNVRYCEARPGANFWADKARCECEVDCKTGKKWCNGSELKAAPAGSNLNTKETGHEKVEAKKDTSRNFQSNRADFIKTRHDTSLYSMPVHH